MRIRLEFATGIGWLVRTLTEGYLYSAQSFQSPGTQSAKSLDQVRRPGWTRSTCSWRGCTCRWSRGWCSIGEVTINRIILRYLTDVWCNVMIRGMYHLMTVHTERMYDELDTLLLVVINFNQSSQSFTGHNFVSESFAICRIHSIDHLWLAVQHGRLVEDPKVPSLLPPWLLAHPLQPKLDQ